MDRTLRGRVGDVHDLDVECAIVASLAARGSGTISGEVLGDALRHGGGSNKGREGDGSQRVTHFRCEVINAC